MLDIFHLENGSYPTMLQELSELDDPEKWDYRRVNSTYEVVGVPLFEK
jgi:hypothetical protein